MTHIVEMSVCVYVNDSVVYTNVTCQHFIPSPGWNNSTLDSTKVSKITSGACSKIRASWIERWLGCHPIKPTLVWPFIISIRYPVRHPSEGF